MDYLDAVLHWMKVNNKIADDESIAYNPDFTSFPLGYEKYLKFWGDILIEVGVEDPYIDQGWTKDDPESSWIEESRFFFEYKGYKFIVRWLNGQGYAHQIILAGQWDEMVPFDETKKVILNENS